MHLSRTQTTVADTIEWHYKLLGETYHAAVVMA